MNIDIEMAQAKIMRIYDETCEIMHALPDVKLSETQHIADEIRHNRNHDWSVRTAAEIVYTAATIEQEKRDEQKRTIPIRPNP